MQLFKQATAVVALGCTLALSACGGSGAPKTQPAPAPGDQPAAPVTITFWHSMGEGQGKAIEKLINDFNDSHKGKIVVQASNQGSYDQTNNKIMSAVTAKQTPTLAQLNPDIAARLVANNVLVPAQSFMDKDAAGRTAVQDIAPGFLESGTFGGKLWVVPFNRSTQVLWVNTDVVKTQPKTWEEFHKAALDATKDKMKGTAISGKVDDFDIFLRQAGGQWLTADGKAAFNSEAGVKALKFIVDMVKDGSAIVMEPKRYFSDYFNQGQVALGFSTSASLSYMQEGSNGKRNWVIAPMFKDANGLSPSFGTNLGIFAGAKPEEQQAAWEFIKFLIGPDQMAYWAVTTGYLPITGGSSQSSIWKDFIAKSPQGAIPVSQMKDVSFQPTPPNWTQARDIITQAVQKAIAGTDPKQALDEAAKAVDAALAKQ